MAYLLDTNACSDYFTARYPKVVARIQECSPDDLHLSVVVVAELRYGADRSVRSRANHARIDALVEEIETVDFDFDEPFARRARLRAFPGVGRWSLPPEQHSDPIASSARSAAGGWRPFTGRVTSRSSATSR
jgi:hypothetical protein